MATPIPVTVLSGFLGSGKTTLLNVLLRAPHGMRLAVIVNEFGTVGIDGALVPQGERFVELDNGCLCCALNDDLVSALGDIVAQGGVDHVLIETTGLADPLPVAWTCTRPQLSQHLRVDSIVTVVDAHAVQAASEQSQEARMQIARADILLLGKIDLVEDQGRAASARVRELNPEAPLLTAAFGEVPWGLILGEPGVHRTSASTQQSAPNTNTTSHPAPAHTQDTLSYTTWSWVAEPDFVADEAAVETLCYAVPAAVFRFKGLVRVDSDEGPWLLVNAVAGRIDLRFMNPKPAPLQSALVFIGQDLDEQALRELCAQGLSPSR